MSKRNGLFKFIAGIGIGVGAGMLLAPKKGEELRKDLMDKINELLNKAKEIDVKEVRDTITEKTAEILSEKELEREREVFKLIDYTYFRDNFGLPNLPRMVDEQIKNVREYLSVSSLTVLEEKSLAVSFRSFSDDLSKSNIVNANAMVQIAINRVLKSEAPKFNKKKFEKAVSFALTQTKNHKGFLKEVKDAFFQAGVVLVVLPNLKNSGINGATKKVDGKVMLMVNDRRHYADTFWFTLFHEIGHILNGDLGLSLKDEAEDDADRYAQAALIPQEKYENFISQKRIYDESTIREFAEEIKSICFCFDSF